MTSGKSFNAEHYIVPKISVILPVYNAVEYLEEAIHSVLKQTIRDFELIVIDDGSTDGSTKILKNLSAIDDRIRPYYRPNRGLVAALNEGIDLSRGKWIARMDADDIAFPDRFAIQLRKLRQSNSDFCGGSVECFGEWNAVWRYPQTHSACEAYMLFKVPFAHPAVMGRRSAFAAIRYRDDYKHCEDYDFWQRAWSAGYKFANVHQIILRYRVHKNQISSTYHFSQSSISNRVRFRHWQQILGKSESSSFSNFNMPQSLYSQNNKSSHLNPALMFILNRYGVDAKEYLVFCIYDLYCQIAAKDRFVAINWIVLLTKSFVPLNQTNLGRFLVLVALSIFKLNRSGIFYKILKRFRATLFHYAVKNKIFHFFSMY